MLKVIDLSIIVKEVPDIPYETKVILIAISRILLKSKTIKEAYKELMLLANAEGIVLEPYEESEKE
ncbi:MAG: hypothetical protein FWE24_09195 [Defluviitaleaceae bacterium]|nr:hypothetical protein [Defluviitaleaceae bacterium]